MFYSSSNYCIFILSYILLINLAIEGVEIRAISRDIENTRSTLLRRKATFIGDYAFTDHIYSNATQSNLNDEFVRIREYQRTNWKQKAVVIVHKVRDAREGNHQTLLKEECDTLDEAEKFIPNDFYKRFSFPRHGWEYCLENMQIYVEEIDGLSPSIEVIAPSHQEILILFKDLKITEILTDSVPEWYCKMLLSPAN